jgi:hypothetical protein
MRDAYAHLAGTCAAKILKLDLLCYRELQPGLHLVSFPTELVVQLVEDDDEFVIGSLPPSIPRGDCGGGHR